MRHACDERSLPGTGVRQPAGCVCTRRALSPGSQVETESQLSDRSLIRPDWSVKSELRRCLIFGSGPRSRARSRRPRAAYTGAGLRSPDSAPHAHRPELRPRRIVRSLADGPGRGADGQHHLRQRRLRVPRRRSDRDAADDRAGDSARRRRRRASGLSRSRRLRPPRAAGDARAKSRTSSSIRSPRSPASPRPRASRCSTSRRTARSTTWRCATARSPTPSLEPCARSIASLILLGLPDSELLARWKRGRSSRRRRSVCGSRLRAGRHRWRRDASRAA